MKFQSANKTFTIDLVEQNYQIGGHRLRLFRVHNLDELVDQVGEEQFMLDERMPYWAELWPSAIGLARYITGHIQVIKDKNVLELGCGLGLTSMAAALCKPKRLLVTDYEQDALDLTRKNFGLNGIALPELSLLDWRDANPEQRYDVILAADILYEERFFAPLRRLFDLYLEQGGRILIAEPDRPVARKFFEGFAEYGFAWSAQTMQMEQDGRPIRVHIFRIHRKL